MQICSSAIDLTTAAVNCSGQQSEGAAAEVFSLRMASKSGDGPLVKGGDHKVDCDSSVKWQLGIIPPLSKLLPPIFN